MEEKKILTDEELDNVVGGMNAKYYGKLEKGLIKHENDNTLDTAITPVHAEYHKGLNNTFSSGQILPASS